MTLRTGIGVQYTLHSHRVRQKAHGHGTTVHQVHNQFWIYKYNHTMRVIFY